MIILFKHPISLIGRKSFRVRGSLILGVSVMNDELHPRERVSYSYELHHVILDNASKVFKQLEGEYVRLEVFLASTIPDRRFDLRQSEG